MRARTLSPNFVAEIPEVLEPGVLYVSPSHATTLHLCACGCGCEVVLPLSPIDWRVTFDGETLSVDPSVGSWALPCKSHYVIDRGRVRWAGDWTEEEVRLGRERDRRRKAARYGEDEAAATAPAPVESVRTESAASAEVAERPRRRGVFARAFGRLWPRPDS